jgi:hypothetical protein
MQQTWCFAVASARVDPQRPDLASQWLQGDDRVIVVPLSDPMALTAWAQTLDGLEHLIYVGRESHAPAMAVASSLLMGRLPHLQVSTSTWHTTTLSLAALSAQVHEVAGSAHEAVAQMQRLVPSAWSGVWMPNVAGLAEPRPSFAQHVRSLVPGGAGYLATLTPTMGVASLRASGMAAAPVVPGSTLIVGGTLRESELEAVQRQAGVLNSVVLPTVEDGKSQYGSADAVELVWMQDATAVVPAGPAGRCDVCRSPVWGHFCPFCHVSVDSQSQGVA